MKAKLFISHHPSNLFLFKNLVKIIRKYDKESKMILFKVNHPYFLKFNFILYEKYFDEIIEFNFINYKKNFFKGYWEIFKFQGKLKNIISNFLKNFEKIDLFLDLSAWLPVNILLYNLSREKNVKNITKIGLAEITSSQTKKDKFKTFLCFLYSLPFKCYKVEIITNLKGKFLDFVFTEETAGKILRIVNPFKRNKETKNRLPYPIIFDSLSKEKKDMIIVFGDESIFRYYSGYLSDYEMFIKKSEIFFKALEDKYFNCKLYYKPHPDDRNKIMPGINKKKYNLFDNTTNAQLLFDKFQTRIKAVYTFSSTSVIFGSFFAVPSYTFYRYFLNPAGIEKLNGLFSQQGLESEFLFHISDLDEIGRIDNLERPKLFDLDIYRKLLKI